MPIPMGRSGNVDIKGREANRTVRRREVERGWRTAEDGLRRDMRERVEQISEQLRALSGVVSTFGDVLARTGADLFDLQDALESLMDELKKSDRSDGTNGS